MRSLMAIYVFVTLTLPRLYGRPAIDDSGLILNMLKSHDTKPEDFSESKIISSLIKQENLSIPIKSRQRRLSDQRLAELETLMTLSKFGRLLTTTGHGRLDPMKIGRRKRFTVDQTTIPNWYLS